MTNLLRLVFRRLRTLVKPKTTLAKVPITSRETNGISLTCAIAAFGIGVGVSHYLGGGTEEYTIRHVIARYAFRKVDPPNHAWHKDKDIVKLAQRTTPAVVHIRVCSGSGTGFFVGEEGLILTNAHVVGDSKIVTVITDDRKTFIGVVQSSDAKRDLALVKIRFSGRKFPIIKLGDSDGVKNNDFVMIFGSEFGSSWEMKTHGSTGSVLGGALLSFLVSFDRERLLPKEQLPTRPILSNVYSQKGFSGAPLINKNGEAVGIHCRSLAYSDPFMIHMSIPSNEAKTFLDEHKRRKLKQV